MESGSRHVAQQGIGNCHGNPMKNLCQSCFHSWHNGHWAQKQSAMSSIETRYCGRILADKQPEQGYGRHPPRAVLSQTAHFCTVMAVLHLGRSPQLIV